MVNLSLLTRCDQSMYLYFFYISVSFDFRRSMLAVWGFTMASSNVVRSLRSAKNNQDLVESQILTMLQDASLDYLRQANIRSHEALLRKLADLYQLYTVTDAENQRMKQEINLITKDPPVVTIGRKRQRRSSNTAAEESERELETQLEDDVRVDHSESQSAVEKRTNPLMTWNALEEQILLHAYTTKDNRKREYLRALAADSFPTVVTNDDRNIDYERLLYEPAFAQFTALCISVNVQREENAQHSLTGQSQRGAATTGQFMQVSQPSAWVLQFLNAFTLPTESRIMPAAGIERPMAKNMDDILYTTSRLNVINPITGASQSIETVRNYALDMSKQFTDYASLILGSMIFTPTGADRGRFMSTIYTDFCLLVHLAVINADRNQKMKYVEFLQNEVEYVRTDEKRRKLIAAINEMLSILKHTFPDDGVLFVNRSGTIELRQLQRKSSGMGASTSSAIEADPSRMVELTMKKITVPEVITSLFNLVRVSNIHRFRRSIQDFGDYTGIRDVQTANTVTTASPLSHMINFDTLAISETQKIYKSNDKYNMKLYRDAGHLTVYQTIYARIVVAALQIMTTKSGHVIESVDSSEFVLRGMQEFSTNSVSYASVPGMIPGILFKTILDDESEGNIAQIDMSQPNFYKTSRSVSKNKAPIDEMTSLITGNGKAGESGISIRKDRIYLFNTFGHFAELLPKIRTVQAKNRLSTAATIADERRIDPVLGSDEPRCIGRCEKNTFLQSTIREQNVLVASVGNILVRSLRSSHVQTWLNRNSNYWKNVNVRSPDWSSLTTTLTVEESYHDQVKGNLNFYRLPIVYNTKMYYYIPVPSDTTSQLTENAIKQTMNIDPSYSPSIQTLLGTSLLAAATSGVSNIITDDITLEANTDTFIPFPL